MIGEMNNSNSFNKNMVCEELDGLFRIKVPFESVYTSVFLLKRNENILVDCATYESDVKNYILPALDYIGCDVGSISKLVLTHAHLDHSGGLEELLKYIATTACVVKGELANHVITSGVKTVALPGHSLDSIGVVDNETNSLISGDAIQLWGIGKYGCGVQNGELYIETLDKIEQCDFANIFTSHEYAFLGEKAIGKAQVQNYIAEARANYLTIVAYVHEKLSKGIVDISDIQAEFSKDFPLHPKLQGFTIQAIKQLKWS